MLPKCLLSSLLLSSHQPGVLGYVGAIITAFYHSEHSPPQSSDQPGEEEERQEGAGRGGGPTEEGAVSLPADVEGEAVDVAVPALGAQHPHHRQLLVGGVGVAGVLGPGRQVGDEVLRVVPAPPGHALVAAALPEAGVAGGPGHVPPVVLAAQLDGVGEAAGPPARRGQARLPGVRSDRQTEVRLGYADTEEATERTGRLGTAWNYTFPAH